MKKFFSEYGWNIVIASVVIIGLLFTTPFGQAVTGATSGFVNAMSAKTINGISGARIPGQNTYTMLNGANQHIAANPTAAVAAATNFRSEADISKFQSVAVDGSVVDPSLYTVTEGSTIITFKPEFYASLSEGEHVIEIVSDDGSAFANFSYGNVSPGTDPDEGNDEPEVPVVTPKISTQISYGGTHFTLTVDEDSTWNDVIADKPGVFGQDGGYVIVLDVGALDGLAAAISPTANMSPFTYYLKLDGDRVMTDDKVMPDELYEIEEVENLENVGGKDPNHREHSGGIGV